jgi:hypothetical protein
VNASIDQTAVSLGMATLMGACIGFERQWRQRMAGLRTNTLVSIGAASFVVFSGLFPGEDSPTRMAAQVVSGIGFLGAGINFARDFTSPASTPQRPCGVQPPWECWLEAAIRCMRRWRRVLSFSSI